MCRVLAWKLNLSNGMCFAENIIMGLLWVTFVWMGW
jgi:hypothetical protein